MKIKIACAERMTSDTILLPVSELESQNICTAYTLPDPLPLLPPSPLLLSEIDSSELLAEPYELSDVYTIKLCYTSCGHTAEFDTIMSEFDNNVNCKTCDKQYEWVTYVYRTSSTNSDTYHLKESNPLNGVCDPLILVNYVQ